MSRTRLTGRNLPAESRPGEGERERQDRESNERGRERENILYYNTGSNIENTCINYAATGIKHGRCNFLDRRWQQTPGPPQKSTQHRGPGTGDLEGEKRGRQTEEQGRLDTLIFLVGMNRAQKSREGAEMLADLRTCSVDPVCVPSSAGL